MQGGALGLGAGAGVVGGHENDGLGDGRADYGGDEDDEYYGEEDEDVDEEALQEYQEEAIHRGAGAGMAGHGRDQREQQE